MGQRLRAPAVAGLSLASLGLALGLVLISGAAGTIHGRSGPAADVGNDATSTDPQWVPGSIHLRGVRWWSSYQGSGAAIRGSLISALASSTSWPVVSSPNRPGSDYFLGASCVSRTFCVAVGGFNHPDSAPVRTLIEVWNGASWKVASGAVMRTPYDSLSGVDCTTLKSCWAVGQTASAALFEHWNGSAWRVARGPAGPYMMSAVSCASSNSCVAVGSLGNQGAEFVLNGGRWIAERGGPRSQALEGVSCPVKNFCEAVGEAGTHQFAESWNGTRWTSSGAVSVAIQRDVSPLLQGVSCWTINNCFAVGFGAAEELAGGKWSALAVPIPRHTTGVVLLFGISCVTASSCVVVGSHGIEDTIVVPMIDSWNGRHLTVIATPEPLDAQLRGVALARGIGVAVGLRGQEHTFIEQR